MVIHSSPALVNPRAKPRFVVQVFDRKGGFCSNSGFPQRAGSFEGSVFDPAKLGKTGQSATNRTRSAWQVANAKCRAGQLANTSCNLR